MDEFNKAQQLVEEIPREQNKIKAYISRAFDVIRQMDTVNSLEELITTLEHYQYRNELQKTHMNELDFQQRYPDRYDAFMKDYIQYKSDLSAAIETAKAKINQLVQSKDDVKHEKMIESMDALASKTIKSKLSKIFGHGVMHNKRNVIILLVVLLTLTIIVSVLFHTKHMPKVPAFILIGVYVVVAVGTVIWKRNILFKSEHVV